MTSPDLIETTAKAIYEAFDARSKYGQHVSIYKFHGGETCLDGQFDLDLVARAAIEAVLRAVLEEASTNSSQMTYDDALDFVRDFIKVHAINLEEKGFNDRR